MKTETTHNEIFIADAQYFCPKATLECGQIFRFNHTEEGYEVFSSDKRCVISKTGNDIKIKTDFPEYFLRFFDLDFDYGKTIESLKVFPELSAAAEFGKGIRILRQDLTEMILSFIISANNNIPRIKGIISRICEKYGADMGGYKAFPTLMQLRDVKASDYRQLGAGFRDSYLETSVKMLLETNILKDIQNSSTPTEEIGKKLKTLKGVGQKVADCILLFGARRLDSYPVDTWIFKACKTEELNTPELVRKYYTQRYGEFAGLAQQYVFYYSREKGESL